MKSETKPSLNPDQALKEIFSEANWTFKVGIGCLINGAAFALLMLTPVLLPISFCLWSLAFGYKLMTINLKAKDPSNKLPDWNNLLDLLIGGGTWIGAWCTHLALLLLVASGLVLFGDLLGLDNVLGRSFIPWAIICWTLIMLMSVLVSFFSLYLMVNFAVKQQITSAFAVKDVWKKLLFHKRQFLEAWLIQTGLVFLAAVIPAITVVGIFLIPSTLFLAEIIGCCLISQAWHSSELES